MRKTLIAAAVAFAVPAGAQDAGKGVATSNDLAMTTDTMIHDGQILIVNPDGHLLVMNPMAERRKALQTNVSNQGVEVAAPMIFMLRDGKLMRTDSANGLPASEKAETVK